MTNVEGPTHEGHESHIVGGGEVRTGVCVPCTGTRDEDGGLRGMRGGGPMRGGDGDGQECVERGDVGGSSGNHRRSGAGEYEGAGGEDEAGITGGTGAMNEPVVVTGEGGARLTVAEGGVREWEDEPKGSNLRSEGGERVALLHEERKQEEWRL